MKNYYYADADNQPTGPFTFEQLVEAAQKGVINNQTMIAAEGDSEWKSWETLSAAPGETEQAVTDEPVDVAKAPPEEVRAPRAARVNVSAPAGEAPRARLSGGAAGDRIVKTYHEALKSFKQFATNPVGGLPVACRSLDQSSALAVGIAFGVVYVVCTLWALYKIMKMFVPPEVMNNLPFLDIILVFATPFVCLAASGFAARTIFRGAGTLGSDCFIAGSVLLPWAFIAVAAGLLGVGNVEVIVVLSVFAVCLTILMLYSGCHYISELSEKAATFAVPIMLILSAWLAKIIFSTLLESTIKDLDKSGLNRLF